MKRFVRSVLAAAGGFAAGLVIGPFSLLMGDISDVLIRGWEWPKRDRDDYLILLLSSIPAAVNGAVGGVLAARFGMRGRLGICVLPAALHLLAACVSAGSGDFLGLQFIALLFSVVVWPAGRLGQVIGGALRAKDKGLPMLDGATGSQGPAIEKPQMPQSE
jgi:hypothetical protein